MILDSTSDYLTTRVKILLHWDGNPPTDEELQEHLGFSTFEVKRVEEPYEHNGFLNPGFMLLWRTDND